MLRMMGLVNYNEQYTMIHKADIMVRISFMIDQIKPTKPPTRFICPYSASIVQTATGQIFTSGSLISQIAQCRIPGDHQSVTVLRICAGRIGELAEDDKYRHLFPSVHTYGGEGRCICTKRFLLY